MLRKLDERREVEESFRFSEINIQRELARNGNTDREEGVREKLRGRTSAKFSGKRRETEQGS